MKERKGRRDFQREEGEVEARAELLALGVRLLLELCGSLWKTKHAV